MKTILSTLLIISFIKTKAQVYSWVAATKVNYVGSGTGAITVWDLELDRQGNSYVTGALTGTAYAGADTVYGGGGANNHTSYTSKISNTGQILWAKTTYGHKSYGVGVDYLGNSYTAGSLQGGNMFAEKLDQNGNSVWTIDFYSNSTIWDYVTDIVTDSIGNSYITGYFFNSITIGSFTLNNAGSYGNVFITKINPSGYVLWAKKIGGNSSSLVAQEIIIDKKYNLYITGSFSGLTDFGGITMTDSTTADIFVAKYDTTGSLISANSVLKYTLFPSNGSSVNSLAIAVDKKSNVYITGYFNGKLTYGSNTLQSTGSISDDDIFVAKVNKFGQTVWAKKAGTTNNDQGWAIALDECSNVWIGGRIQGCASCQAIFDTQTYPSPSSTINSFVAKYSNSGVIQNVKTSTSNVQEYVISMKSMPSGNIVNTGLFGFNGSSVTDTIDFDSHDYISMQDTNYLFAAQINNCSADYNDLIYNIPNPLCQGTQLNLSSGNPNTYWYDGSNGQTIVVNNDSYAWADITTCNSCIKRDSIHIQFIKLPIASFSTSVNSFTTSFTNSSNFATSYAWDFGDTQTSTLINPTHTYSNTGTYTVILTASNICGSNTYSFVINIIATEIANYSKSNFYVYPTLVQNQNIRIAGVDLSNSPFKLINVFGQTIISSQISDTNEIEIPKDIAAGMYNLIIDFKDLQYCKKVIFEK